MIQVIGERTGIDEERVVRRAVAPEADPSCIVAVPACRRRAVGKEDVHQETRHLLHALESGCCQRALVGGEESRDQVVVVEEKPMVRYATFGVYAVACDLTSHLFLEEL